MDKVMFEKCSKSSFVFLGIGEWARVDGFDPEEKVLYVHNEDSGEEYSLEAEDLVGSQFYELKEIK